MNDVINDQNKNIEDIDFADFEEFLNSDVANSVLDHANFEDEMFTKELDAAMSDFSFDLSYNNSENVMPDGKQEPYFESQDFNASSENGVMGDNGSGFDCRLEKQKKATALLFDYFYYSTGWLYHKYDCARKQCASCSCKRRITHKSYHSFCSLCNELH